MATNQELLDIKKGIITAANDLATNGKLNPAQSDKYIDYVYDETGLSKIGARLVKFRNEQTHIDKLNVGRRVTVPAEEGVDPGFRAGVSTSKVVLEPKEVMTPFDISQIFEEHSLEGESVSNHIIRMMATEMANDVEEMFFDGNKLGHAKPASYFGGGSDSQYKVDSLHGLMDGLLKQAESGAVVDAEGATFSAHLVGKCFRAMPTKFRKNPAKLRMLMSSNHNQLYSEHIASRQTAGGDAALRGLGVNQSWGVDFAPLALLQPNPEYVEHVQLTGTDTISLKHTDISEVVVTRQALGAYPEAPYVITTDYTVDLSAGTITRAGGGSISDGETVKVSYKTAGRMILTEPRNIIFAVGRDLTFEADRNIHRRVDEYVMSAKFDVRFEEPDAVVLLKNVAVDK